MSEVQPLNAAWIEARICEFRNERVLVDADLARIYGVETKRLVEQVKRNEARFPADFAWQLDAREASALRSQFATSNVGRGGRRHRPWVFTEHGAIMLANVLKSPAAVLARPDRQSTSDLPIRDARRAGRGPLESRRLPQHAPRQQR